MRPILCAGNYGVPVKSGKTLIRKIVAPIADINVEARLQLVDDTDVYYKKHKFGNLLSTKTSSHQLVFDAKEWDVDAGKANIEADFNPPLTVVNGISVLSVTNLVPGSILVYID